MKKNEPQNPSPSNVRYFFHLLLPVFFFHPPVPFLPNSQTKPKEKNGTLTQTLGMNYHFIKNKNHDL